MRTRGARAGELIPATALVWAGMLLGISFLEAWVKFRAPSLSLEEGLDVGRHVFGAFNKVELAFTLALTTCAALARSPRAVTAAIGAVTTIVAVQSLWLLPTLDDRVEVLLAGGTLGDAPYHVLYIGLELLKLALLLLVGSAALRGASIHSRQHPHGRQSQRRTGWPLRFRHGRQRRISRK
jgi:hypothetical protein